MGNKVIELLKSIGISKEHQNVISKNALVTSFLGSLTNSIRGKHDIGSGKFVKMLGEQDVVSGLKNLIYLEI